jgi:hypothetical protein
MAMSSSNWRKSAERSLPPPRTCDEFRGLDLKRIRNPPEHGDCHRRLRSLNLADIARAQPNPIGQVLLRPSPVITKPAPALEGFAPTPEMPEIVEAQALLVTIEAGAHVRHQ